MWHLNTANFMVPCVSWQEDFVDSDKQPLSTYLRSHQRNPLRNRRAIFLLTEDRERAYTINHEASHHLLQSLRL